MFKKIALLALMVCFSHPAVSAQSIDFSKLKCTDQKTLRAFFTDLNKIIQKKFEINLIDIKNVTHVSASKETINCRGTLIFDSGEQLPAKFWYEVNSVGLPLVYFQEE